MPRKPNSVPAYCLHRASGKAIVRINGRDRYLGPYGSDESRAEYDRVIAEWLASGRQVEPASSVADKPTRSVNEVMLAFLDFAEGYYCDGKELSKEVVNYKLALRPLKQLYGHTPAEQFGPLALKALRQHMIEVQSLCRKEVNKRVGRIKRLFKWSASEELVPASVFEGLRTVEGLRVGRTTARENPPVKPVDDTTVEATLPFVSPQVRAMIQLQRLTGMRPGEVTIMRLGDIDRTDEVWIYRPARHKTSHLGVRKEVPLGPKSQELLRPFLNRALESYLFSPREAEEWRNEQRAVRRDPNRKTKIFPCELRARERRRHKSKTRVSKRPKRDRYDTPAYRRALEYAIAKAKRAGITIPHWHPHQLRHTRATEVRRRYGVEAAQVALCHARADVTEIYAERNFGLAAKIAKEMG
jgi:integrase